MRVECYSGGRLREKPRAFWLEGKRLEVVRVLETSLEETHPERIRRRHFTVETEGGRLWKLTWDGATRSWWLEPKVR